MRQAYRARRVIAAGLVLVGIGVTIFFHPDLQQAANPTGQVSQAEGEVKDVLETLAVKGRAPKTAYSRDQFGDGWESKGGCDTRNNILYRDLKDVAVNDKCQVVSGRLDDPYTGKPIEFVRGANSDDVQIDHVVALSDAWQKGAQLLTYERRTELANDPLELLAVDGPANQQKSDGDAATWLPAYKPFRCQYVARQVAVKKNYDLWVTAAEKEAIIKILVTCPGQMLPTAG